MDMIKENTNGEINWPEKSALVFRDNAQPLRSEETWLEMVNALNGTRVPIPNPMVKTAIKIIHNVLAENRIKNPIADIPRLKMAVLFLKIRYILSKTRAIRNWAP